MEVDNFTDMTDSEITQALDADLSAMSLPELMAGAAANYHELKRSRARLLELLEENPEAVAQHPELRDELEHLRALTPEQISGPGS